MSKITKKEIFTIPNIICYCRILIIPVFMYIYLTASGPRDYTLAAIIVLISSISDLFDGMIARKFNQVTKLGKILDPVADKLNHFAILICLAIRYPFLWAVIVLMIIKEGYMLYNGIYFLKGGEMIDGAMWYGKICTAVSFISLFALFLIYDMPLVYVKAIAILMSVTMIFALVMYIDLYTKMRKALKEENHA